MRDVINKFFKLTPKIILKLVKSNYNLKNIAFYYAKRLLYNNVVKNSSEYTKAIRYARYIALVNLMNSINKALSEDLISKNVKDRLLKILVGKIILQNEKVKKEFKNKYGVEPPLFVVISPEKRCNLKCIGCYAASEEKTNECLEFEIVDKIMEEKVKLWSSHFTVISGGEPLLWRSKNKTILDIFDKYNDNFFLMYTNGTLLTREIVKKLARLGNVTPAISVEGFEYETDIRRGKGVFKKILQAMEYLREEGVPFGISVTATKNNVERILSEEIIDFYFNKQKALYGWIFQYMPIGRAPSLDLMVTPEQRKQLLLKEEDYIYNKKLFLIDFWNGGVFSEGCIAGGKGYFYIQWNGDITPCVFFPYAVDNINKIYSKGGTINDVINSPLFKRIRDFHYEYGFKSKDKKVGNWFAPCPIRDNYEFAYKAITETEAKPIDPAAKEALNDKDYYNGLVEYGKKFKELTNKIWEEKYLSEDILEEKLKVLEKN